MAKTEPDQYSCMGLDLGLDPVDVDSEPEEGLEQGLQRLLGAPAAPEGEEVADEPLSLDLLQQARMAHRLHQKSASGAGALNRTAPVATAAAAGEMLAGVSRSSSSAAAVEETLDEGYSNPAAPLALLRAYTAEGRWVSVLDGFVAFDDDCVQYPASTPTFIRASSSEDAKILSLSSLWLLVAFHDRYEVEATPQVCERIGATRIPKKHLPGLLDFVFGRRDGIELLSPSATAAPADARCLAGGPRSRPPLLPLEFRAASPSQRVGRSMAERLEKLRQDIASELGQDISAKPATGPGPKAAPSALAARAARGMAAEAFRHARRAEARQRSLQAAEAMLLEALASCNKALADTTNELDGARAKANRARGRLRGADEGGEALLPGRPAKALKAGHAADEFEELLGPIAGPAT